MARSSEAPKPFSEPPQQGRRALARAARKIRVTWRANNGPQSDFLTCPTRFALFGGAVGGGKSVAMTVDALGLVGRRLDGARWVRQIEIPSYRALILRGTYPELQELEAIAANLYPQLVPGARWNGQNHTWTMPSGAQVMFGYVGTVFSRFQSRYRGIQFSYLGWDEACDQREEAFVWLLSRLRNADPRVYLRVRLTANPQGVGMAWVKRRFVSPAAPGTIFRTKSGHTAVFIPSRISDNPSLAATDYLDSLKELTEADQQALVHGNWDAYQGLVFRLVPGKNVWTWEQFRAVTGLDAIPAHWERFRVMDWGFERPGAIYWLAADTTGRVYVYREWYLAAKDAEGATKANQGARLLPEQVAERIKRIEEAAGERISAAWTGPDVGHLGRGDHAEVRYMAAQRSMGDRFAEAGVHWRFWDAGPGSRRNALLEFSRGIHIPAEGWPKLIFIQEECPEALRTIPILDWDPDVPGDINSDAEDHAYDALKGFCLMRSWGSTAPVKPLPKWMEAGAGGSAFVL